MPTKQPANSVSNTERDNYDKSVGRLAQASQLEKLLLWAIAIMVAIGLAVSVVGTTTQGRADHDAITRQTQELSEQKKTIDTLVAIGNQRSLQITDLQSHIDCIFALFGQTDRSNLVITNITNCQLSEVSGGSINTPTQSTVAPPTTTTKTAQPSAAATTPAPTTTTTPKTTPVPTPVVPKPKSTMCKITFGLLGC